MSTYYEYEVVKTILNKLWGTFCDKQRLSTLEPEDIQKACSYHSKLKKKYCKAAWRDASNGGRSYIPSYNMAPTNVTPVLVSGSHFNSEDERVLQPMMWGMIPFWHKGDYKSHGLSTNNCRIENLESSKLYKKHFLQGQRCVVICDGFYEWQTTKGKMQKQPYFIYLPQQEGIKIEDPESWNCSYDENFGWKGPVLMKLAGIFNKWTSPEGEEIYSYSIITLESNEIMSWLHHRMPAILSTEESISNWLDYASVNSKEALACIKPVQILTWHPVSTLVNNSRNKDITCNKPLKTVEKQKKLSFMEKWLISGNSKSVKEDPEIQDSKRSADEMKAESSKRIKIN